MNYKSYYCQEKTNKLKEQSTITLFGPHILNKTLCLSHRLLWLFWAVSSFEVLCPIRRRNKEKAEHSKKKVFNFFVTFKDICPKTNCMFTLKKEEKISGFSFEKDQRSAYEMGGNKIKRNYFTVRAEST